MASKLSAIRARLEAYEAAIAAHESLEPGEWNTTVRANIVRTESTLEANAPADLRALLTLAEAVVEFDEYMFWGTNLDGEGVCNGCGRTQEQGTNGEIPHTPDCEVVAFLQALDALTADGESEGG